LNRELLDVARLVAEALGLEWDSKNNGYIDRTEGSIEHVLKPDGSNLSDAHWFKTCTLKLIRVSAIHLEDSSDYRRMAGFYSVDGTVDLSGPCAPAEAPARLLAALQARSVSLDSGERAAGRIP
jgi:hypothetical protein